MATNPSTLPENVGRITAPDANYTYGSAKDDSTGTAADGTPIKKDLMNDSYGFFQAAMVAAGIVPSGTAETVLESQILQALQGVVGSFSDKSQWPTVANGVDTDHDIAFSSGKITDSNGLLPIVSAGVIKQIDVAWVVGGNSGGLFSGTVAANTTYHLFLIVRDSDGLVDAGFDIDPGAANIPTGFTTYRRIASIYTDNSSNIVQFFQQGDYFGLREVREDFSAAAVPISPGTVVPISVPDGLSNISADVLAKAASVLSGTSQWAITPIAVVDTSVDATNSTLETTFNAAQFSMAAVAMTIPLDNSASIRVRASVLENSTIKIHTKGWTDDRR